MILDFLSKKEKAPVPKNRYEELVSLVGIEARDTNTNAGRIRRKKSLKEKRDYFITLRAPDGAALYIGWSDFPEKNDAVCTTMYSVNAVCFRDEISALGMLEIVKRYWYEPTGKAEGYKEPKIICMGKESDYPWTILN